MAAGRFLLPLLIGLPPILAACSKPARPAPVDAGAYWPTYMGSVARTPFLHQHVPEEPPSVLWISDVGLGIRGMPIVTDQVIVAATTNREIRTVSRQDGSTLWHVKLKDPPVSPLLIGSIIYTVSESSGDLQLLNMVDGETIWNGKIPSVSRPFSLAGDTLIVATDDGRLFAFRSNRAEVVIEDPIWVSQFPAAPSAGPVVLDDWVVYVTHDSLFVVTRSAGRRRAAAHVPGIVTGEAAADGSTVYLTAEDGALTAWSVPELELMWESRSASGFWAGPVIAGDTGYAATRSGELVRFDSRDGFREVIARMRETVVASPTVVENGVLVGTLSGHLHFFSRNGRPIWVVELQGQIVAPAAVQDGRITVTMYGRASSVLKTGSRGRIAELR